MNQTTTESQFVPFCLGDEISTVPVTVVQEIVDHEELFKIPQGPNCLMGLRDVGRQGVPIIDLRPRLGMSRIPKTSHTRYMLEKGSLGVLHLVPG